MPNPKHLMNQWRTAVAVAVTLIALSQGPAAAQQVVAVVNGDPITAMDIAQRTKLILVSTRQNATRQQVLDELIDEKLKLQVAKRYKLEISDSEVESSFNGIATRAGNNPQQFAQALQGQGISPESVKQRIRADMGWGQIVRGKFQSRFQIRERDIIEKVQSQQKEGAAMGYEYTLRPILLIVPRGAGENEIAARHKEAEGLRNRFQNCEEGIRLARGLKDVAVRDAVYRTSGELSASLRDLLEKTPEGKLTPPEVTRQGVELYAICRKREASSELPGKREARETMMNERFVTEGKAYLKELRAGAMIEYR
jgi:peptidyl-prolyl cis-trans isomerase SurA